MGHISKQRLFGAPGTPIMPEPRLQEEYHVPHDLDEQEQTVVEHEVAVSEEKIRLALAPKLEKSPLDHVADLIGAVTYGEMMELAEEIWKHCPGTGMSKEDLPGTLHRWSIGRKNGVTQ